MTLLQQQNPRSALVAQLLAQQAQKPIGEVRTPLEGLGQLANKLSAAYQLKNEENKASEEQKRRADILRGITSPSLSEAPRPSPDFMGPGAPVETPKSMDQIIQGLIESNDPQFLEMGANLKMKQAEQQAEQGAALNLARLKSQMDMEQIKQKQALRAAQPPEAIRTLQMLQSNPELLALDNERKRSGATQVNVNNQGESAFVKEGSKLRAKNLVEDESKARQAVQSLQSSSQAKALLDSGVISGFGADYAVGLGKALQQLGFNDYEDAIANTEAFVGQRAQEVGRIIQLFGAGTGLSDADRAFATKAAAGDINMTEASIRRLLDIQEKASRNVIQNFNARIADLPDNVRESLFINPVEVPEFEPMEFDPVQPEDQAEPFPGFNQLPPEDQKRARELLGNV